jgi:hypothetical protein
MKERSGLKRTGSKIVFGLISAVILTWTAYLTTSFLSMVLPASFWIVPYLGLVVFDGGMIGWLTVYLYMAEGAMQRAIALGLTLFNLLGVGLMTIAEIVLGGQTLTAAPEMLGTVAIWAVGIWTFVNVAGIIAFHLSSPDARIAAAIQDEKDAVVEDALTDMRNRRGENAKALGAFMGGGMFKTLVSEIGADVDGDGLPDLWEKRGNQGTPQLPAPGADYAALVALLAANPQLLSLVRPVDSAGNSTHAPQPPAQHAPGQGQGNGPAAKPLGPQGDGRP